MTNATTNTLRLTSEVYAIVLLDTCDCVETAHQLRNCIDYRNLQTTVATVNCSKCCNAYIHFCTRAKILHTGNGESQACSTDGAMRLVDGSTVSEGRLEICHNGQWGTICNQGWTDSRATQVCSRLGLPTYSKLLDHFNTIQ